MLNENTNRMGTFFCLLLYKQWTRGSRTWGTLSSTYFPLLLTSVYCIAHRHTVSTVHLSCSDNNWLSPRILQLCLQSCRLDVQHRLGIDINLWLYLHYSLPPVLAKLKLFPSMCSYSPNTLPTNTSLSCLLKDIIPFEFPSSQSGHHMHHKGLHALEHWILIWWVRYHRCIWPVCLHLCNAYARAGDDGLFCASLTIDQLEWGCVSLVRPDLFFLLCLGREKRVWLPFHRKSVQ